MAQPAGQYNQKITVLRGVRTKDEDTGEMVLTHDEDGYLWGSIEITNGRRVEEYGAPITGGDGQIKLRNYPSITVDDMLRDTYGVTYHIEDIIEGDNELILTVYYHDDLEDFTEGGS